MALITERICCDFAASDGRVIPLVGDMMLELKESDGRARRFRKSLYDKGSAFEIFGVFRRDTLKKTSLHRSYIGSDCTLIAETALLGRLVYVPDIIFYNRELRIDGSRHELSHCRRLVHLIDVAIRHGEIVPPTRTLAILLVWALGPLRLARYMTDLIAFRAALAGPAGSLSIFLEHLLTIFLLFQEAVSRGPKERRSTSCD